MKALTKRAILGTLCLCAAFSGGFAITKYASAQTETETATAACVAQAAKECYVLRDCDGYVAVYDGPKAKKPTTVTDIQVSTLRALDRQMLENGLELDSREKLMMTLEDLGS